jgi:NADH-quinone oxidoreductase subunit J
VGEKVVIMGLTLFMILAAVLVVSALVVIFNRNVVHSALALLVNFCVLAVLYFMLNAQFLAIVQVLVYAGAIVVLFLFVVMLLGAELGEQVTTWLTTRNALMVGLGLVLLTIVGSAVFENPYVFERTAKTGTLTPEAVEEFGQIQVIGSFLFTDYILPFHLIAVLLSVGVVGILWLAQQQKRKKIEEAAHD